MQAPVRTGGLWLLSCNQPFVFLYKVEHFETFSSKLTVSGTVPYGIIVQQIILDHWSIQIKNG